MLNYLKGYEREHDEDPRQAAREWFDDVNYRLYSLLGNHEWVQYHERIDPADYAQFRHHFTAESFDSEGIADFARSCGMEYVTLTVRHYDRQ